MKVLVLNSGSSSLKYKLFDMKTEELLFFGHIDGIGLLRCVARIIRGSRVLETHHEFKDHVDAITYALNTLKEASHIKDFSEIKAVCHRVVHGGEYYSAPVIINEGVLRKISELSELAPLHNPANLAGIVTCRKLLPKVLQVAVFDTAFHQTMPEENFLYALPYSLYKDHKVRRYGFHGISHQFVTGEAVKLLGNEKLKIITCHLGAGASITAVKNAKSFATSMGFTPLEGLVMATRAGDFDPAVLIYLNSHKEFHIKDLNEMVNKQSGLLGLSGSTSDMRELRKKIVAGDKRAKLAVDVFVRQVVLYIGAYVALLGGVDAIVFTAGIGEGSWSIRKEIMERLEYLGIVVDAPANRKGVGIVSSAKSKVKVLVIPTNEELQMAREARGLVS